MLSRVRFIARLLMVGGILLSAKAQALSCVPYAREESGIGLKGDAWTWWSAAAGQYERGRDPREGAVVVFKKHGGMSRGHVAVVAQVLNPRKLLIDHANWAPSRSHRRGAVSKQVMVTDVSPGNDWTQVKVWNAASGELGSKTYPIYGFIYPRAKAEQAIAAPAPVETGDVVPVRFTDPLESGPRFSLLLAEPGYSRE